MHIHNEDNYTWIILMFAITWIRVILAATYIKRKWITENLYKQLFWNVLQLTWGDFVIAGTFDYFKAALRIPDLEKEYPAFQQLLDNVYSDPKVKAYADAAPKSTYGF